MDLAQEAFLYLSEHMECKIIWDDLNTWNKLVAQAKIAQVAI